MKGRGAICNPPNRFHRQQVVSDEPLPDVPATVVREVRARSLIVHNRSPDVPFELSINPYAGCEHGCIYCYARPSHAYLDLSPGLDFETRLFAKTNAAELLEAELSHPAYRCRVIALGANTDAYQPIERRLNISRSILEVCSRFGQPITVITKSGLIVRDLDLLTTMARRGLASVAISVTSLQSDLKRRLEPRAASPQARLRLIKQLTEAGVPVTVLVAPVIPKVTDHELEAILQAAQARGASAAGYILLRLPRELGDLFSQWLTTHYPLRAKAVMSLMRQYRGGVDYRARFGERMRGVGPYADLLALRFRRICCRLGLGSRAGCALDTSQFRPPPQSGDQLSLAGF